MDQPDKPAAISSISDADANADRLCVKCGCSYYIADYYYSESYFSPQYDYTNGCVTHCLECWLGLKDAASNRTVRLGKVLRDLSGRLGPDWHLVVLPLIRVHLEQPVRVGSEFILYPPVLDTSGMDIKDPAPHSMRLNERLSAITGVDASTVRQHSTVAFAAPFNWDALTKSDHQTQVAFLAKLSQFVDDHCLNLLRYRLCRPDRPDTLPGRAGQLNSDPMMAGVVLYNAAHQKGLVLGGPAFTHLIVRGLGCDVAEDSAGEVPKYGEVGHIARRALALYTAILEAEDESAKFMQCTALLDFLAEPSAYVSSKQIATQIGRYVATTELQHKALLNRFGELHGGTTEGKVTGYRTQIVHLGKSLDEILPSVRERAALFAELDAYIRKPIDHMIEHSHCDWVSYDVIRKKLGPTGKKRGPAPSPT